VRPIRFTTNGLTITTVLVALLGAVCYYLTFRGGGSLPGMLRPFEQSWPVSGLSDPTGGWLPSFLHAIATLAVLVRFAPPIVRATSLPSGRSRYHVSVLYLAGVLALLAMEACIGVTALMDVVAILVAASLIWWLHQAVTVAVIPSKRNRMGTAVLVAVSGLGAMATGPIGECAEYDSSGTCIEYKRPGEPIYMSYGDLRSAVEVQAARPLDRLGRLYIYGDYLFLNERNEGIHVIDNHDPTQPVNIAFIRIPGNQEINIREGYLYADSYIDLVTLDLSDPMNVREVNRHQDVFPYDAFQNIPYNISFRSAVLESERGVVVSYVE